MGVLEAPEALMKGVRVCFVNTVQVVAWMQGNQ